MSYGILEQSTISVGDYRHEHEIKQAKLQQIAYELETLARVLDHHRSCMGGLPADKARQLADRVRKLEEN